MTNWPGMAIQSFLQKDCRLTWKCFGENMENTRRKVVILKPQQAWDAYREMLHYYAVTNMMTYLQSREKTTFQQMHADLRGNREKEWVNLGGQVMLMQDLDNLRSEIGTGKLASWNEIHERYDQLWEKYQRDKQKHACATLCYLYGKDKLSRGGLESRIG